MILSLCSVCAKQILFVQSSQENIFCVQNQIIARKFARKRVRNGLEESLQFLAWARRRCCSIQRISPEEGFSVKKLNKSLFSVKRTTQKPATRLECTPVSVNISSLFLQYNYLELSFYWNSFEEW